MRLTGLILVIVGLIGGAFCVTQLVMPAGPQRDVPVLTGEPDHRLSIIIPLAVSGIAVVVGGAMLMFGGRSYYLSNNPRVRN